MPWALVKDGEIVRTFAQPQKFRDNDKFWHPPEVFTKWSPAELKEIGILPIVTVNNPPTPLRFYKEVEPTVVVGEDEITWTINYEPIPLEDAKQIARSLINNWKLRKQDSNFTYNDIEFQADERSRGFITGAALEATVAKLLDQPYLILFTDANNADHVLDADGVIALGQAAATHIKYWHQEAKSYKTAVNNAATIEDMIAALPEDLFSEG